MLIIKIYREQKGRIKVKKLTTKKGGSDLIVILIAIVIFAAVSFFSFTSLGNSIGKGTQTSQTTINNMLK